MTPNRPKGIVSLVGAGPGDPGLITVKGRRLLELADAVVYDNLANPRLLSYCPRAHLIYVGKKSSAHTLSQEQINDLLVDLGLEGKRVVRLKGGDPFIFGRGGEECLKLVEAGVAFEIVPGVTSAVAAGAYAGIPITHRDLNSSFTLITGHESTDENSDIAWPAIARLPCLAFYMGVAALEKICARLIGHGMPATMPAATIQSGTLPNQRTVTATVGTLAAAVKSAGLGTPAVTIIGKVVSLRPTLQWFENRPLFGQTILVTRTRQQASEISQKLEDLGAQVIEAPTVEIVPPEDLDKVDAALARAAEFDWIVFTSVNGVEAVRERLVQIGKDARAVGEGKIAAVGDATAEAVRRELFRNVDLCPEKFVAEALADALDSAGEISGKRFLLPRADIARPILRERLMAGGAKEVCDLAVYENRIVSELPGIVGEKLRDREINWITFASASAVRNLLTLLGSDAKSLLANVRLAAIGPITERAMVEAGLKATVTAADSSIDGLIAAIGTAK